VDCGFEGTLVLGRSHVNGGIVCPDCPQSLSCFLITSQVSASVVCTCEQGLYVVFVGLAAVGSSGQHLVILAFEM